MCCIGGSRGTPATTHPHELHLIFFQENLGHDWKASTAAIWRLAPPHAGNSEFSFVIFLGWKCWDLASAWRKELFNQERELLRTLQGNFSFTSYQPHSNSKSRNWLPDYDLVCPLEPQGRYSRYLIWLCEIMIVLLLTELLISAKKRQDRGKGNDQSRQK